MDKTHPPRALHWMLAPLIWAAGASGQVFAGTSAPTVSYVATAAPTDVAADLGFLSKAWSANAEELAAARLALERSRDVRVREFAQVLVRDHAAASVQIERLAGPRAMEAPAPVRLSRPAARFDLDGLRGAAFDRRFVAAVGVQAHRDALALFRDEVAHGKDRQVVQFATRGMQRARKHLAGAEALQAQFELRRRNLAR